MKGLMHRRYFFMLPTALFVLAVYFVAGSRAAQNDSSKTATPKYVFLFLVDGGGITHMEITRQYNRVIHDEGLVITEKIIKEGVLGLMTNHAAAAESVER